MVNGALWQCKETEGDRGGAMGGRDVVERGGVGSVAV